MSHKQGWQGDTAIEHGRRRGGLTVFEEHRPTWGTL